MCVRDNSKWTDKINSEAGPGRKHIGRALQVVKTRGLGGIAAVILDLTPPHEEVYIGMDHSVFAGHFQASQQISLVIEDPANYGIGSPYFGRWVKTVVWHKPDIEPSRNVYVSGTPETCIS